MSKHIFLLLKLDFFGFISPEREKANLEMNIKLMEQEEEKWASEMRSLQTMRLIRRIWSDEGSVACAHFDTVEYMLPYLNNFK